MLGRQKRASQQQRDQQHRQAAQHQQDEVFQLDPAAVLLVGFEQKIHRGPIDDLEPPFVEQVDEDRRGDGQATQQHPRIQKPTKHLNQSIIFSNPVIESSFVLKPASVAICPEIQVAGQHAAQRLRRIQQNMIDPGDSTNFR